MLALILKNLQERLLLRGFLLRRVSRVTVVRVTFGAAGLNESVASATFDLRSNDSGRGEE